MSDLGASREWQRRATAPLAHARATAEPATKSTERDALTVLHVVAPAAIGGLESVVRLLSAGQQAAGDRVSVACILDGETTTHPFVDALTDAGISVHPIRIHGRDYREERRAIRELCILLEPHVVHTHGYRPDVVDAGVARALSIPTVTTVHGFTGNGWRNRFYEWLQVRSFRRYDAVVAVSRPLAKLLAGRGVGRDRLHVLPNAYRRTARPLTRLEARTEMGIPHDARVVGWVGRLSREKGPDVLLSALSAAETSEDVIAVLVGVGREQAALREQARQLGIEKRVRFLGAVAHAERLFTAFDVLALSSRTEGTPMVLFEALAARVPVVAASVGGVPDVLGTDTALLVPPEDPAALAHALAEVFANPDGASRRAERGWERLTHEYDLPKWIAGYDALYRQLLHHR